MAETKRGIKYNTDELAQADILEDMKILADSVDEAIDNAVVESTYDDTQIKQEISNIKEGQAELSQRVTESETEITSIQEEQVDQNTNIENLQTENQELKEKLAEVEEDNEKLRKVFPSVKGEGSEITLNGTAECKMDIKVKGNTEQEQYDGSNLYNVNDKTDYNFNDEAKIDEDGFITVTCDNTLEEEQKYINLWTKPSNLLKTNTNYYIVLEVKNVKGDGNFNVYSSHNTNSPSQFSLGKTYNLSELNNNELIIINASTLENFENSKTMLRTFFTFNPGDSGSITFRLSVLENQPTEDDFQYEPYTGGEPAPNPNFIIPIENCGDNENRFNKYGDFNYGNDNHKTSLQEDGTIISTSNRCDNRSSGILIENLDKNTDYVISGKLVSANGTYVRNATVDILEVGTDHQIQCYEIQSSVIKPYKFETSFKTGDITSVWVSFNGANNSVEGSTITIFDEIKLEKGKKATPYSPYDCGSLNIKVSNKNIIDFEEILKYWGSKYTKEGEKYIITNGNYAYSKPFQFSNKDIQVTLSAIPKVIIGDEGKTCSIQILDERETLVGNIVSNSTTQNVTCVGSKIRLDWQTSVNSFSIENIQITEGKEVSTYEPRQEQNYPFTLEKGQRLHKDDYLADNGTHQVWKKIELTGEEIIQEQWRDDKFSTHCFRINANIKDNETHDLATADIVCQSTHFVGTHHNGGTGSLWLEHRDNMGRPYLIAIIDNKNSNAVGEILIKHSDITTSNEMETFLREQKENGTPVIIEYKLQDEIVTPYTQTQQEQYNAIKKAMSYSGATHITATSEGVNPILEVEAIADMSSVINNFDTRLLALESEV